MVTGVVIALAHIDREEPGLDRISPVVPAPSARAVAPAVIGSAGSEALALGDCRRRLQILLADKPLNFDARSDTLKAEIRQVLFAIIEVAADCPGSRLKISATLSDSMSDYRRELTRARMNFLQEQFAAGGLAAEKTIATPPAQEISDKAPAAITLEFAPSGDDGLPTF